MHGEVMSLLLATWGMLMALVDLALTAIGAFVVVRWLWRRALRSAFPDADKQAK